MRLLFYISIYNYFREVEPLVQAALARGHEARVVLGWRGGAAEAARDALGAIGAAVETLGVEHCYLEAQNATPPADEPDGAAAAQALRPKTGRAARIRTRYAPHAVMRLFDGLRHFRRQRRLLAEVEAILRASPVDALLLGPSHSAGTGDQAFHSLGLRLKMPVFCYPVSAYHGRYNAISARFQNLRMGMIAPDIRVDYDGLNRMLSWVAPNWVARSDGMAIFPWNPIVMTAAKANGLLPRDVWQKPDTRFDTVFVYSQFSQRLLLDADFPAERIAVTGIPLLDRPIMNRADAGYRAALFNHLRLNQGQDFLLVNVEPSLEHHYASAPVHWANLQTVMEVSQGSGLPIVVSLHPLCRLEDYRILEDRFGARVSTAYKIHDLYPFARAVLSFPCSTNILAEIFARPLVIYDFHDMAGIDSPRRAEFRLPYARVASDAAGLFAALREVLAVSEGHQVGSTVELSCPRMLKIIEERVLQRPSSGYA